MKKRHYPTKTLPGLLAACLAAGLGAPPATAQTLSELPPIEGFGKSRGGAGGRVIKVTHLGDRGEGSLRAAIEASGPRVVVFEVAGEIFLESSLTLNKPFITIAGHTAPGDGITVRNRPSLGRSSLRIRTHDVMVRFLRFRPGPSDQLAPGLAAVEIGPGDSDNQVYDVVIDHCSMSWSTDEILDVIDARPDNDGADTRAVTIQWSIFSEPLNDSTHGENPNSGGNCENPPDPVTGLCQRPHPFGMLLGSSVRDDGTDSYELSVHHNLFAHLGDRAPLIRTDGVVDVVNNVVYNIRQRASKIRRSEGIARVNYVGNTYREGPDTRPPGGRQTVLVADANNRRQIELFLRGNDVPPRPPLVSGEYTRVPQPHPVEDVATMSAREAFEDVLDQAGASARLGCRGEILPRRDAVDRRIVKDVRTRRGGIIDHPDDVGGWPRLDPGTPCRDEEAGGVGDGMPDRWERDHGLDPGKDDRHGDPDGDGIENLEEYLNATDPQQRNS